MIIDTIVTKKYQLTEWNYSSTKMYNDPFNAVELDILITSPQGKTWTIPTFWRAEHLWSVRFIPEEVGIYKVVSLCSDKRNSSLHQIKHTLEVSEALGDNRYMPLSLSSEQILYQDEKPFFWLADTWWMGLSERLSYPNDFQQLADDRKEKGFTVIQLVAGLFPDMDHFDERSKNEAGMVWERDYSRINPSYFDKADERIEYLIATGLVPCILGAWGYYLHTVGEDKMKQHWRYIIARWGVYPVVWCIAGEAAMPYYLSKQGPKDMQKQIKGWTKIGHYIRKIDPYKHIVTIHPTDIGRNQVSDPSILDLNMLQAGHGGYPSTSNAIRLIHDEKAQLPHLPIIMSEVNYEGIMHDTSAEIQRLTFWCSILSGASGFTYGANGVWQVNTKETPFGASPHGGTWGNTPWNQACQLEGATHIGLARKLLEGYEWWRLKPHQEWYLPQHDILDYKAPRIAGIEKELRIIYIYGPIHPWSQPKYKIAHLEQDVHYEAFFWDPRTADEVPVGSVTVDGQGEWIIPTLPTFDDWILVMRAISNTYSEKLKAPTLKRNIYVKIKKFFMRYINHLTTS